MSEAKIGAWSGADLLILSCSGSSDVGEIADQTARSLARDGVGKTYWLTGIGGRIARTVKTAQAADQILAIDGCTRNCASLCLKEAGFEGFATLRLAELGMEKGMCPATEESVARAAETARAVLAAQRHRDWPRQEAAIPFVDRRPQVLTDNGFRMRH